MSDLSRRLKRFERRVRLVRAWRGLAVGLLAGGALGVFWSALDWYGVFYTEWLWLGILVAIAATVGAVVGFFLPISEQALADSIDRRARLAERLTTAREHGNDGDLFDEPLVHDAVARLESVRPASVFPFRVGRWQAGGVAMASAAAAIFLLGNTPILLSPDQKKQLEELKREGAKVERILREHLDDPEAQKRLTEEERRLANDLLKLKRDLEKGRMTKEEALQKADELAKEAEKLMREHIKNTKDALGDAESALDKLRKQAMDQVGMQNADPNLMKMTDAQRESAIQQAKQEIQKRSQEVQSLQSQLDALNKRLSDPNLSAEERKRLEEQRKQLERALSEAEKKLAQAQEELEALELSKEAQEVFKKMMDHPLYKKLQELAQKLAENAEAADRTGVPKLTKEERERLQKELEELAKKLKDDKAMQEYLQALLDAMQESGGT